LLKPREFFVHLEWGAGQEMEGRVMNPQNWLKLIKPQASWLEPGNDRRIVKRLSFDRSSVALV